MEHPNAALGMPLRRRNWTHAEKAAIVQEANDANVSVSMVAKKHGIATSMLFRWRKMDRNGLLSGDGHVNGPNAVTELLLAREKIAELQNALGALALEVHLCTQENQQLKKNIAMLNGKAEITRLFTRQAKIATAFDRSWHTQKEAVGVGD